MEAQNKTTGHELKVIGAGVGRTGTLSLMAALDVLGMKAMHMKSIVTDGLDSVDMWRGILERRLERTRNPGEARGPLLTKEEWGEVLHKYDATLDFPVCMFYDELRMHYPEAKVILTVRDADSWYTSIRATIASFHFDPVFSTALHFLAFLFPSFYRLLELLKITVWRVWALEDIGMGENIGGALSQRKLMMKVFNEHNNAVKRNVPPQNLLVFNPKEGWKPLCEFLNVPIPNQAFPNVNSTKNFPHTFRSVMPFYLAECARRDGLRRLYGTIALTFLAIYSVVSWLQATRMPSTSL